jgi:hypothetical protein
MTFRLVCLELTTPTNPGSFAPKQQLEIFGSLMLPSHIHPLPPRTLPRVHSTKEEYGPGIRNYSHIPKTPPLNGGVFVFLHGCLPDLNFTIWQKNSSVTVEAKFPLSESLIQQSLLQPQALWQTDFSTGAACLAGGFRPNLVMD